DLDDLLILASLGGLFLIQIFELSEIENLRDRGIGVGGNLHQIQSRFLGDEKRFVQGKFAEVNAFGIDELDPGSPDFTVGARSLLDGCRCLERSANGSLLLKLLISRLRLCPGAASGVNS